MNAVEMRGISKNFGTVQALSNVDFTLRQGEIHAVLGENGAGKTTLMKILYGMHKPSSGEIFLNGKSVTLRDSQAAIRAGVGMVHQHFMLIPVLTVAENIVAGREPRRGVFFDFEQAVREVEELEQRSGFQVDPRAKVETLAPGADNLQKVWQEFLSQQGQGVFAARQRFRRFHRAMDGAVIYLAVGVVALCVVAFLGVEYGWFGQSYLPSQEIEGASSTTSVPQWVGDISVFVPEGEGFVEYTVHKAPGDPEQVLRQMVLLGAPPPAPPCSPGTITPAG